MNQKQKLGYILLGAAVMAVGITIGQFVPPNIEAQSVGELAEIRCSKLTVVDGQGNDAIILAPEEDGNTIVLFNKAGKEAVYLIAGKGLAAIDISNPSGKRAISLSAADGFGNIVLKNSAGGICD